MGKHKRQSRCQNNKRRTTSSDEEVNAIREQQQCHHQTTQNNVDQNHRHPPKMQIVIQLENGISFSGTVAAFNTPNTPKSKIFFKDEAKRELSIVVDVGVPGIKPGILQLEINNQLRFLHEDAVMEFPEWLEKYSTRVSESNLYFNLDEIREEFRYKKSRFGIWRIATQVGFFDDIRPQFAKFNRIVHLEIREPYLDQCIKENTYAVSN